MTPDEIAAAQAAAAKVRDDTRQWRITRLPAISPISRSRRTMPEFKSPLTLAAGAPITPTRKLTRSLTQRKRWARPRLIRPRIARRPSGSRRSRISINSSWRFTDTRSGSSITPTTTRACSAFEIFPRQSGHRPLHGGLRRRGRVSETESRQGDHASREGLQNSGRSEHALGNGRHADQARLQYLKSVKFPGIVEVEYDYPIPGGFQLHRGSKEVRAVHENRAGVAPRDLPVAAHIFTAARLPLRLRASMQNRGAQFPSRFASDDKMVWQGRGIAAPAAASRLVPRAGFAARTFGVNGEAPPSTFAGPACRSAGVAVLCPYGENYECGLVRCAISKRRRSRRLRAKEKPKVPRRSEAPEASFTTTVS